MDARARRAASGSCACFPTAGRRRAPASVMDNTYARAVRLSIVLALLVACGGESSPPPRAIRFLHTFDAKETELFNATMAERRLAVDSSLVPFARGQQMIGE